MGLIDLMVYDLLRSRPKKVHPRSLKAKRMRKKAWKQREREQAEYLRWKEKQRQRQELRDIAMGRRPASPEAQQLAEDFKNLFRRKKKP